VQQHALDVLAGADQVGLVVGAGARVVQFVERLDVDAVHLPGDRLDVE
jgi:hypothetical protein